MPPEKSAIPSERGNCRVQDAQNRYPGVSESGPLHRQHTSAVGKGEAMTNRKSMWREGGRSAVPARTAARWIRPLPLDSLTARPPMIDCSKRNRELHLEPLAKRPILRRRLVLPLEGDAATPELV